LTAVSSFPPEFLARLERMSVRARKRASGLSQGRGKGTTAGSGVEFVDIREYSPGDDLRAVDWNLYARLDRLLIRVFQQDREHDVHVLLDVSRSMIDPDREKFRRAARIAGALAYVGLARLDRVAVWPIVDSGSGFARPFPLAAGKRRAAQLFRWIEGLEPSGTTDLSAAADTLLRSVHRGVVIVVSDLYDLEGAREGLAKLARAGLEVSAVQVLGEGDAAPRASGRVELIDAETGRAVRARIGTRERRAYQEALAKERAAIAELLVKSGGAFALAPPERPIEDVLLRDLRRAGVLA